ncbi:hypothetical protein IID22_05510 [Patescibacteria group bacterium]|nr:hypothetical protein [Patescibacteria group bacterium]
MKEKTYKDGLKKAIQIIKRTEKQRWSDEVHCSCLPFTIHHIEKEIKKYK